MNPRSLADSLEDVQVVDVREDFEWEAGRIDGSTHIPVSELPARSSEIDPSRPVVAVCFAGGRSAYASRFLQSQGFNVMNLDGGLKSWVAEDLPLVQASGEPGRLIHDPPAPTVNQQRDGSSEETRAVDHGEGEPDLSPQMEDLKNTFIEAAFAVQERFGDDEPSEEELRSFFKEWLVSKGKSAEEAEQILNR